MREPLSIAVAQPVCTAYDVVVNVGRHAEAVRAARARVVVFPELSITGYELDAPALPLGDARLAPLVEACADTGTVALVGAPIRDPDGREYIATLAVSGTGVTVAYRKIHVHSTEDVRFGSGEVPGVVDVDGWRLGLAICRDTGIPEHPAATAAVGMDAYVAGVLFAPDEDWKRDERMREITRRYRVWGVMACFAGPTGGYPESTGGSGVWGPDGVVRVEVGSEAGAYAVTVLS